MPTIVHFDISADDIGRATKFYSELFDWRFEKLPGPVDYALIVTRTLSGEEGLGGGMGKREKPDERITNFVGVPSVDEYIKKAEELGGRVVQPKTAVPNTGYLAVCLDTENNTFGLWEDNKNAK